MSLGHGASIIRNGLVLHLDAANTKSYPGTGTAWIDLSGQANNATLVNSPTYSNGSFLFNGTNQSCSVSASGTIPVGSAARTVSMWFYTTPTSWADNNNNLFFQGQGTNGNAFGIDMAPFPSMEFYSWGGVGRDLIFTTPFSLVGWHNITVSYGGATTVLIYGDGVLLQTVTLTSALSTTSSTVSIGSAGSALSAFYEGNISNVSIYNRTLSAAEVRQNFEATRGRYGI